MNRLFVGTEKGLELLSERPEGWHLDHTVLADYEISCVLKRPNGTLLVGTRQAGLFNVDPSNGRAVPVGAGILPKGIRCVAAIPEEPDRIFAGCEPTAMFKTDDGGRTWRECVAVAELAKVRNWQYHMPQIPPHIRHILIDRENPQRIYAAVQIGGVLRSEDGGHTWTDVVDTLDPDVHAIVQDPEDANVLYAATGGGGPIGGPHPPVAPFGYPLYRSDDAGKTWRTISSDFLRRHGVPLHVYPKEKGAIVAATGQGVPPTWRNRSEGADAVLVISRDRGQSWTEIHGDGLPSSFPVMVETIDTERTSAGRTYIGIGGEGTKALPPNFHHGEVFYANDLDGPWKKVPRDFPVIFTVTAG